MLLPLSYEMWAFPYRLALGVPAIRSISAWPLNRSSCSCHGAMLMTCLNSSEMQLTITDFMFDSIFLIDMMVSPFFAFRSTDRRWFHRFRFSNFQVMNLWISKRANLINVTAYDNRVNDSTVSLSQAITRNFSLLNMVIICLLSALLPGCPLDSIAHRARPTATSSALSRDRASLLPQHLPIPGPFCRTRSWHASLITTDCASLQHPRVTAALDRSWIRLPPTADANYSQIETVFESESPHSPSLCQSSVSCSRHNPMPIGGKLLIPYPDPSSRTRTNVFSRRLPCFPYWVTSKRDRETERQRAGGVTTVTAMTWVTTVIARSCSLASRTGWPPWPPPTTFRPRACSRWGGEIAPRLLRKLAFLLGTGKWQSSKLYCCIMHNVLHLRVNSWLWASLWYPRY